MQFPDLSALQAFVVAKCLRGRKRVDTCSLCESLLLSFFRAAPPIRGISIVYCIRDHTAGVQNVWVQYVTFVDPLFWHYNRDPATVKIPSFLKAVLRHIFTFVADVFSNTVKSNNMSSKTRTLKILFYFFSYQGEIHFINSSS